jgi:hypothetical protein
VQYITLYHTNHTIYLNSLNLYSNLLKKKKGVRNLAKLKGAVLQLDSNGMNVYTVAGTLTTTMLTINFSPLNILSSN